LSPTPNPKAASQTLTLRVVLTNPTAGVDFGLQQGHGSNCEIVQKQRSKGTDLTFELPVTVKTGKEGEPDFSGPFVQGRAGDRFFYINIGTYAGQENTPWGRRLKIPLSLIKGKLIRTGQTLSATIPGTDKEGGPSCAYEWRRRVDPSWQWQVEK